MLILHKPSFARHDKGTGKKVKPNSFRHYFVSTILLSSGNLKLSQELARHESISTTNRYVYFGSEIDAAYTEIFNKK